MEKTLYIAMAVAALTAISCQKEKELHPVGSRIVFSAATEFRNGLETRTLYTGQYTQTSPAFERIQWVSTDQIKILYSHGSSSSATYSIDESSIAGSGTEKKSTASISVASGSSALEWAEGSSHIFYGLYPADGGTLTAGSATGLTIPATQTVTWNADQSKYLPDMDKAYMVSYKDMSSSQNSTVDLPFTPVMNAVEFKLRLPDDRPSYTVTQVKFSASASTAIAGTYSVDITGFANDAVTWSVPNNGITSSATGILINFNNGSSSTNPAIPTSTSGNYLNFTVLTLPVAFSDPLLQIKYSDGHVLKVTLTGLSLQAGQKCIVSNSKAGHDDFTYELSSPASEEKTGHDAVSFTQINVSSIKRSGADNNYTEAVAWKVQYYNTTQSNWYDVDDATYPLSGYSVNGGYTLTEDHTNNTLDVSLNSANGSTRVVADSENITPFDAATELLKARTSKGTENDPYDLSTHDLSGNVIGQTAANCYVVTAPGWYKFPLIYGNARVLGVDNSEAYHPTTNSSWNSGTTVGTDDDAQNYYLPSFYNAAGDVIDSPYILTDLGNLWGYSATVGGTTAGSSPSVHHDGNHGMDTGIITGHTLVGSGASAYVKFHVSENNIKPGNTRLLLEGSAVNTQNHGLGIGDIAPILWSWHIWVTDKDLTPQNGVMPYNLGWVDKDEVITGSVSKYTDRSLQLRIVQLEGTPLSRTFTLTQRGDIAQVNYVNPTQGTSSLFQWGRKEPYSPTQSTVPLTVFSDNGESTGYPTNYWYWRGIRFPEVMLASEKSRTWMDGKAIPLYESTQTQVFDHNDYSIKSTSQKTGPFTTAQKNGLAAVIPFNNGVTFTQERVIDNYTLAATTYGPFTESQRTAISGILSGMWTSKKRVVYPIVNNAAYVVYFNGTIKNYAATSTFWVTDQWNSLNGWWYIIAGTALTDANLDMLKNLTNANYQGQGLGQFDNYENFKTFCLEPVHWITLSSAVTVTPSQKNTLVGQGFSSNAFTENSHLGDWYLTANGGVYPSGPYTESQRNSLVATGVFTNNDFDEVPQYTTSTTYSYTSDASRNAGSILYNLWDAYRYNENCSDPSGGKMKTVYDPCPPGFTVPTRETYLGNNSLSNKSSSNLFSGGGEGTDYPYTGARLNTHASVTGSPDNVSISNASSIGYYWTDHPCNMSYSSGDKTVITSYLYYQDAYILKNTSGNSTTVEHISRATAAAVRPMVDPRASSIAGHATPAQVSASNPIESVTMGPEL